MLLEQAVLEWLAADPRFFARVADGPVLAPTVRPRVPHEGPPSGLIEPPPPGAVEIDTDERVTGPPRFYRLDFVRRDAENRRLGRMGEEWVVEFEQRRLHDEARRPDLARKVEWIADTRGDGAGYDIASFNLDESPRLIEVKSARSPTSCPAARPRCRRSDAGVPRPAGSWLRRRILSPWGSESGPRKPLRMRAIAETARSVEQSLITAGRQRK